MPLIYVLYIWQNKKLSCHLWNYWLEMNPLFFALFFIYWWLGMFDTHFLEFENWFSLRHIILKCNCLRFRKPLSLIPIGIRLLILTIQCLRHLSISLPYRLILIELWFIINYLVKNWYTLIMDRTSQILLLITCNFRF